MPKHQQTTKIILNEQLSPGVYRMAFRVPEMAREAEPGQFVHLKITGCMDPLLRRPFSIFYADPAQEAITVVYQVAGRGSQLMSQMEKGDTIDVMGPLGKGFDLSELRSRGGMRAVLVGGGLGIPPLYFLAVKLMYEEVIPCSVLVGAKTESLILGEKEFKLHLVPLQVATEDGSRGHQGLVTDLLKDELDEGGEVHVFACGPLGMLKAVAELCRERSVLCQVSLEARMACGVGACLGCAVPRAGGGHIITCSEGPAVWAEEVAW